MKTWYVATLSRYVLVDAKDEKEARDKGHVALHAMLTDVRKRLGCEIPVVIRTVRPATEDERKPFEWHYPLDDEAGD